MVYHDDDYEDVDDEYDEYDPSPFEKIQYEPDYYEKLSEFLPDITEMMEKMGIDPEMIESTTSTIRKF